MQRLAPAALNARSCCAATHALLWLKPKGWAMTLGAAASFSGAASSPLESTCGSLVVGESVAHRDQGCGAERGIAVVAGGVEVDGGDRESCSSAKDVAAGDQ